jgi:hypothetical protein
MKLPIDTSALNFLCATAPEPVRDFESKQLKVDENGQGFYSVQLVALAEGSAQLITVKVPGVVPTGLTQGSPAKVTGLVASPWTMGERSGVSFKATRIEPAVPASSRSA